MIREFCKECGKELDYYTVNNFQYCWWECPNCDYISKDIPEEIREFHKRSFDIGEIVWNV